MSSASVRAIDELGVAILRHASMLTRLVLRHARTGLSRSEVSVLATLRDGPQRISALADAEGLAQPTVTLLVGRLEERGWVRRERTDEDGRVVLVRLTVAGEEVLDGVLQSYRVVLREGLRGDEDEQRAELEVAEQALGKLVGAFQERLRG